MACKFRRNIITHSMIVDACKASEVRVMLLMEFIIEPVPVVNEVKVSLGKYDSEHFSGLGILICNNLSAQWRKQRKTTSLLISASRLIGVVIVIIVKSLVKGNSENIIPQNVSLKFNKSQNTFEMHLPIAISTSYTSDRVNLEHIDSTSAISDKKGNNLIFTLNKSKFITQVINSIYQDPMFFWKNSDMFDDFSPQNILIEFSSPNIAKPFHMGHLRSTIIGNFLSNLYSTLGHQVVKINYLGDWGTQFGMLNVGLQLGNISDSEIAKNPIKTLYEAYVFANKQAENNPAIHDKAREIFRQLEVGDCPEHQRWEKFKLYTVKELESTYARLGVQFDEYQWESMFGAKDIQDVLTSLRNQGILTQSPEGRQVAQVGDRQVTLVKSDGSSLYLTRDIAAALYRYDTHKFNHLLYVVDNSQNDHFTCLRHLLGSMGYSWAEQGIKHVKFGRVRGMSTRKGQVVLLRDILDEAKERVVLRQQESATTKEDLAEETSDILAVSAVVINDLKQRRQRDYEFNWNSVLQMQGDGGIKLQYTHCRLCSLEKYSQTTPAKLCHPETLTEPEAFALITELARFDHVLEKSYREQEACILVNYLFTLSNLVNQAFKKLQVKGQDNDLASQRLLLFHCSKLILAQGLIILGLRPLDKM